MKLVLFAPLSLTASLPALAGSPQVDCYEYVYSRTNLSADERVQLCSGAKSNAPAACYELAYSRTNLSADQRAKLCSGAKNNAPVACYELAYSRTNLSADQRVALCKLRDCRAGDPTCNSDRSGRGYE
jgi:hypothetical protein